jgi:hypothetical protein
MSNLDFKIKSFIFALILFLLHVEEAKGIAVNAMPLTMPQHPMRHFYFMKPKSEEFKKKCIEAYASGLNFSQVSKLHGVSAPCIRNWVKKTDIRIRTLSESRRVYKLNEQAFNTDSPEANYWAGFLAADGSVSNRGVLNLTIQNRDIKHLESFRNFIGTNAPFYHFKKHNTNKLEIASKTVVCSLEKYGIGLNKTLTYQVPELIRGDRDFWRGMIDGDGHISIKDTNTTKDFPIIGLCGTIDTCNSFREYCLGIHQFKAKVNKHGSIFALRIGGAAAVSIIRNLYGGNPCESLSRKYEKAMSII